MKTLRPLSFLLLFAVVLTGCSILPRSKPRDFLLDPGAPPSFSAMRSKSTIAVDFVDVATPFAGGGFVYRVSNSGWETDAYNRFLIGPAQMTTSILRNWLTESQLFREVSTPGDGGGQTYLLNAGVTELYGDFQNPFAPVAVMTMRFQVVRANSRQIVMQTTFTQTVPVSARTPEALIEAWNEALRMNLTALLKAAAERSL